MASQVPTQTKRPAALTDLAKPARKWTGGLDGWIDGYLFGWAICLTDPAARVVVELCLNGRAIHSVICDVFRADLLDETHDGCHGFVAHIGSFPEGALSARIANTDQWLTGDVALTDFVPPPQAATQHVFGDGGLLLQGVAMDPQNPDAIQKVVAFEGAHKIAETEAQLLAPFARGGPAERHGFQFKLPLDYADGQSRQIRVVDRGGQELLGSPVTVCCHAEGIAALAARSAAADGPLLQVLGEHYERYLPRALGMEHFATWYESFEFAPSRSRLEERRDSNLAVLIHGEGDFSTTRASLAEQISPPALLSEIPAGGEDFAKALERLAGQQAIGLVCIRAGDTLAPHALAEFAATLRSGIRLAYSDSTSHSSPYDAPRPWFKPAWNSAYAFSTDYPLEGMVISWGALGKYLQRHGAPSNYAALAWGVLADCLSELGGNLPPIAHLPRLLYHLDRPLDESERSQRDEAVRSALAQLEPCSILENLPAGTPHPLDHSPRRLRRTIALHNQPMVSLIIPTRDQADMVARCIESLQRYTAWPKLEILVVDNDSCQPATQALFRKLRKQGIRVLHQPGGFNYSRINNVAVSEAKGEIIGLINNDIEAFHDGWLEEMLSHLLLPGVGAVGAKLLWPNGMVQHGGVYTGVGYVAGHYGNWLAEHEWSDHSRNQVTMEMSAVTAACLLLRKQDYLAVGGLDELAFPVAFNDVDLCLKLRKAGSRIVWTPFARLIHAESASRGKDDSPEKKARARREVENLRQRWGNWLQEDPSYHPCLSLDAFSPPLQGLAVPPRSRQPRLANGQLLVIESA